MAGGGASLVRRFSTARAFQRRLRLQDPACTSYSQALLYYKGFHAIQTHRIAHALWKRGQRVMAMALQSRMSEVLAVDIHPAARIGGCPWPCTTACKTALRSVDIHPAARTGGGGGPGPVRPHV